MWNKNSIIRKFNTKTKVALKENFLIIILLSIISFIYSGLFQSQRGHFIDLLQNSNNYNKYKLKLNIEKSSDTTTTELF